MNDENAMPVGMAEILRMAAELSDRIRAEQEAGIVVPDDRIVPLVKAALLLEDHGVSWPPGMMQVLQSLDRSEAAAMDQPADTSPDERGGVVADEVPSGGEGLLGRLVSFGRRRG